MHQFWPALFPLLVRRWRWRHNMLYTYAQCHMRLPSKLWMCWREIVHPPWFFAGFHVWYGLDWPDVWHELMLRTFGWMVMSCLRGSHLKALLAQCQEGENCLRAAFKDCKWVVLASCLHPRTFFAVLTHFVVSLLTVIFGCITRLQLCLIAKFEWALHATHPCIILPLGRRRRCHLMPVQALIPAILATLPRPWGKQEMSPSLGSKDLCCHYVFLLVLGPDPLFFMIHLLGVVAVPSVSPLQHIMQI